MQALLGISSDFGKGADLLAAGQKWVPKMGFPGKWNQGLKPVVLWWSNFDPHPPECQWTKQLGPPVERLE